MKQPKFWCVINDGSQLFKDTVIEYMNENDPRWWWIWDDIIHKWEFACSYPYYWYDAINKVFSQFSEDDEDFQRWLIKLTLKQFISLFITPMKPATYEDKIKTRPVRKATKKLSKMTLAQFKAKAKEWITISCKIDWEPIVWVITIYNWEPHICQDKIWWHHCPDKKWYKCSWIVDREPNFKTLSDIKFWIRKQPKRYTYQTVFIRNDGIEFTKDKINGRLISELKEERDTLNTDIKEINAFLISHALLFKSK